jgi:hypothetical protein
VVFCWGGGAYDCSCGSVLRGSGASARVLGG